MGATFTLSECCCQCEKIKSINFQCRPRMTHLRRRPLFQINPPKNLLKIPSKKPTEQKCCEEQAETQMNQHVEILKPIKLGFLSVPLLQHSTEQIIKSHCLSICKHSYGRNFDSILMKFCTVIRSPESKIKFVCDNNLMTPSPILPQFLNPVMHFQWESSYTTAENPVGLIVMLNSSKSVSWQPLKAYIH